MSASPPHPQERVERPSGPSSPSSPSSLETVVVVVLLREDGAALFQLRDDKPGLRHAGLWGLPGGHREPGESLEASARRELYEETSYRCGTLSWLTTFETDHDPGWPRIRLVVFWTRYDGTQPLRCLEGQAIQFIERDLAASYCMPGFLLPVWDAAVAAAAQIR